MGSLLGSESRGRRRRRSMENRRDPLWSLANETVHQKMLVGCEVLSYRRFGGVRPPCRGVFLRWHTRSSPIGPALHEEGGSLGGCQYIAAGEISMCSYRPCEESTLACHVAELRCHSRGRPYQVSQLLVDALQSHGERGCVRLCVWC